MGRRAVRKVILPSLRTWPGKRQSTTNSASALPGAALDAGDVDWSGAGTDGDGDVHPPTTASRLAMSNTVAMEITTHLRRDTCSGTSCSGLVLRTANYPTLTTHGTQGCAETRARNPCSLYGSTISMYATPANGRGQHAKRAPKAKCCATMSRHLVIQQPPPEHQNSPRIPRVISCLLTFAKPRTVS
jgi:hypothetical protein